MTVIKSDTAILKNYINGEWVDAQSTRNVRCTKPGDWRNIGEGSHFLQ